MDDLISRKTAVKFVSGIIWQEGETWYDVQDRIVDGVSRLPSAESKTKCIAQIKIDKDDMEDLVNEKVNEIVNKMSEIKTGKWVDDCACSICHWIHEDSNGFALITEYNYCPNCGAKMEVKK